MPTDCLSTAMSRLGPRMPRMVTAAQERRLWHEAMAAELKCEGGGGRLPISRSAIPAGSQARMLLTYVRLVEGADLKRAGRPVRMAPETVSPHEDGDAPRLLIHRGLAGWGHL